MKLLDCRHKLAGPILDMHFGVLITALERMLNHIQARFLGNEFEVLSLGFGHAILEGKLPHECADRGKNLN